MRRLLFLLHGLCFVVFLAAQASEFAPGITPGVPPGAYASAQLVTLVAADDSVIYFTFDESRDQTYTRYTVPILLDALDGEVRRYTLRVEARSPGAPTKKKEFVYIIDRDRPVVPVPVVSPGTYFNPVEFSFPTDAIGPGETMYLTVFEQEIAPPRAWNREPIRLAGRELSVVEYEVQGYSIDEAGNSSDIGRWRYLIDRTVASGPTDLRILSPVSGTFANRQYFYVDREGFRSIRYTLNGDDPAVTGAEYTVPFTIDLVGMIELRVTGFPVNESSPIERTVSYTVAPPSDYIRFRPENGVYDREIELAFDAYTSIRYTLDDAPPDRYGLPMTAALRVSPLSNGTRAVPFRFARDRRIPEYRFFYLIDDRTPPTPTVSFSSPTPLRGPATVSIDASPYGSLHYTIDGTTPGADDPVYRGPFLLSIPEDRDVGSIFVKAVSIGANGRKSATANALATFDLVPPQTPEIAYLGKSGMSGIAIGVESEFGSVVHYELTLDDSVPPVPTTASPRFSDVLRLEVPYGMERMFSLRFAAADTAGNVSEPSDAFRLLVDRVAPPPPVCVLDSQSLVIEGEGAIYYTLTDTGAPPPVPTTGSSRYVSPIPLPGAADRRITYLVRAVAVDTSGNSSEISAEWRHTVDRRTPTMPAIVGIVDGRTYREPVRITVGGGEPGVSVRYSFSTTTIPPDPDQASPQIGDGVVFEGRAGVVTVYTVKLIPFLESTGASGEITVYRVIVDRDPPKLPIFPELQTDSIVQGTPFILRPPATYVDRLSYAVTIFGSSEPDPFGAEAVPFVAPIVLDAEPGAVETYLLRFAAEDDAGNRTLSDRTYRITVDRKAPEKPFVTGAPATNITREPVVLNFLQSEDAVRYQLSTDGNLPARSPANSRVANGPLVLSGEPEAVVDYALRYYAVDRAGNESPEGFLRFTIDRQAPRTPGPVTVSTSENGAVLISFPAACEAKIYYRIDGTGNEPFQPYDEPLFVIARPGAASLVLDFYARDRAGNQSAPARQVVAIPVARTDPIVTGVVNGSVYNSRRRITNARAAGVVRYLVREDGIDPGPVDGYAPVLPAWIDFDTPSGRTSRFVVSLAWFLDATDVLPFQRETVRFTIDRNPPPAPTLVAETAYSRQDLRVAITAEEGEIYVSINERSFARYTTELFLAAAEGRIETYRIRAYAKDEADNRSVETGDWTVVIDKSDIYVSLSGNDLYDGSRDRPFRTLERALQEASRTRRRTINLTSGNHLLRTPLVIEENLVIRGGFDENSWKPDSGSPSSRITAASSIGGRAMLLVRGASLEIDHVVFISNNPGVEGAIIDSTESIITTRSVQFSGDRYRVHPLLRFTTSEVDFRSTTVSGIVDDSAMVEFIDCPAVSISDSVIHAGTTERTSIAVAYLRVPDVRMTATSVSAGTARDTIAIRLVSSTLEADSLKLSGGFGRASATALFLHDSSTRLSESRIDVDERSWIGNGIDADFSTLLIDRSSIIVRGNRGVLGISASSTAIDMNRSFIRGEKGKEFVYLVQLSNSNGSIVNSILSSSGGRDQIAIDLDRSPLSLYHNTIAVSGSTNLAVGVRVQGAEPPYVVNTVFSGSENSRAVTSVAIMLVDTVSVPRLFANAFGGFNTLLSTSETTISHAEALNSELDDDPEGGAVQLNIRFDPAVSLSFDPDGLVRTNPGSELVNSGIDLNLIGLRVTLDYDGEMRPQGRTAFTSGYDIGADEVE